MATVTVNVPNALIKKLADGDLTIGLFFVEVFKSNSAVKTEVRANLLAFHNDVGGSPEVETFEVDPGETTYDTVTHTGKIVLRYRVRFYYGCADINKDEPATERADFEINMMVDKLAIHIHDPITRDTVDEF